MVTERGAELRGEERSGVPRSGVPVIPRGLVEVELGDELGIERVERGRPIEGELGLRGSRAGA